VRDKFTFTVVLMEKGGENFLIRKSRRWEGKPLAP